VKRASQLAWMLCVCVAWAACKDSRGTSTTEEMLDALPPSGDLGVVDGSTVGPNKGPKKGLGRGPTQREARAVGELMRAAERVREKRFLRDVPVVIEDRERITAYVEGQIEEDELEEARVVYTALGLLPPGLDVKGLLLRVMGEQIVGYYDAEHKRLVVRDDVMRAFTRTQARDDAFESEDQEQESAEDMTEARIVLVHELVHALQDQHLALSEQIGQERATDADNAFHALVEGDATLAMIGYALEGEQLPLRKLTGNPAQVRSFSDVVRQSPLAGSELERAPPIVRVPLLSAYVDGLAFCATLHGSNGWASVDLAHKAPPSTTEHILHPERFARGELPVSITLPALLSVESAGYVQVREDTLGELELSVYFGQGATEDDARRAADGWNGDRLRVYQNPQKQTAVVWLTAWDSDRDADEAEQVSRLVLEKAAPATRALSEVVRRGRSLLVLRDLPDPIRAALRERFSADGLAGPPASPTQPR
jgi:hypothetical protein